MSDVALVIGGASEVWDDLERALEIVDDPVMIAVNDAIAHCPYSIDHAVTLHPEKLVGEHQISHNPDCISWLEIRARHGYNMDFDTWSRRNPEWVDHRLNNWGAGSSGLYGVTVAYHLEIPKIILCGVPVTATPHFDGATGVEGPTGNWDEAELHWHGWEKRERQLRGRVKSMSGRTKQLLGEPDEAWIQTEVAA